MKRVVVKGSGIKLNNKWCFKGQEEIISEDEYIANKEFVNVLEDIRESNERVIEVVVTDETIDIEELKKDLDNYVKNYKKVPEVNSADSDTISDENVNEEDDSNIKPSIEELRAQAKDLGIKNAHLMGEEKLIEKINELAAPKFGENNETGKEETDETPKE